jgi:PGF-CTERM protein
MRRRQLLTTTAGLVGVAGAASGRRTALPSTHSRDRSSTVASQDSPTPTQTDGSEFGPLGQVSVPEIKEAVVGSRGSTVFAAVTDGFATIDVSDPTSPTVLAERRELLADRPGGPMRQVYDVKRDGDTLVVVGPANPQRDVVNAAVFYDVSDPEIPEQTAVHETRYPIHNCDFAGGVAYLTGNWRSQSAMVAVEYDGSSATEISRWSIAEESAQWESVYRGLWALHDITVHDDHAYLAHWDAGTWIVDVADPTRPSLVTRVRGRPAEELAALETSQARREALSRPGNDHHTAVSDDGDLLGIGVEAWNASEGGPGPGGITLYDISTPTEPQRLSRIEPPSTPNATYSNEGTTTTSHNFDFDGDRLYTSWYQGGVRVFDVSDPANPTELAAYRNDDETSFWTAVSAGDFFVAPSGEKIGENYPGRLYTFPDPGVDGYSGPSNPLRPETDTPSETATATDTPTTTSDVGTSSETAAEGATTTSGSGPGFGIVGSLAALGIGAWRLRRRRGE